MSDALRDRPPTQRQIAVLRAIHTVEAVSGYAPTVRELAFILEISSLNAIRDHLVLLRRRGLVTWVDGKARTLRLTSEGRRVVEVSKLTASAISPSRSR